jgi:hypothetical protein
MTLRKIILYLSNRNFTSNKWCKYNFFRTQLEKIYIYIYIYIFQTKLYVYIKMHISFFSNVARQNIYSYIVI